MSFIGEFHHTIDGKGRISIPSKYREIIHASSDGKLIMTTELEPCLAVYPFQEWEVLVGELDKLPRMDTHVRNFSRVIYSKANECSLDKQGRILIPMSLREYAGLDENACVIGNNKNFEIWNPERWSEIQDSTMASTLAIQDGVAKASMQYK